MKNLMLVMALLTGTATLSYAGDAPGKGGDMPSKPDVDHHGSLHYSCRLDGNMKGMKLGFGPGGQILWGRGEIHCSDMRHGVVREVRVPVKMKIIGAGVGFDFTIVKKMKVTSGGIGYVHDPMDLTGSFSVGSSAGVTLIKRGYAIQSAVSVKKHVKGLAFELGFAGEKAYGLGARLHGTVMYIKPIKAKYSKNEKYNGKEQPQDNGKEDMNEKDDGAVSDDELDFGSQEEAIENEKN